jgi:hypothetical protein
MPALGSRSSASSFANPSEICNDSMYNTCTHTQTYKTLAYRDVQTQTYKTVAYRDVQRLDVQDLHTQTSTQTYKTRA